METPRISAVVYRAAPPTGGQPPERDAQEIGAQITDDYDIREIFTEEAGTGDPIGHQMEHGADAPSVGRPAFARLLAFLEQKTEPVVVLIPNSGRITRNIVTAAAVIDAIISRGGSISFRPSPLGLPVPADADQGTAVALHGQFAASIKAQTERGMRHRLETGYWPFRCPPGYVWARDRQRGGSMVLDPSRATLVREALMEFASRPTTTVADVERHLSSEGFFGDGKRSVAANVSVVRRMLRQVLYAGYVEYAPWGITLRKGRHPQIIALDTYQRIQAKLHGGSIPTARENAAETALLVDKPVDNSGRTVTAYRGQLGCPTPAS